MRVNHGQGKIQHVNVGIGVLCLLWRELDCAMKYFLLSLLLVFPPAGMAGDKPVEIVERFDESFDPSRFITSLPNKNTEVREGVLWTRGSSGGKYPPMVYLAVEGKDMEISFRYRHLGDGGFIWFFVDGDDGFGSIDHMLRVKFRRDGVQLQVDSHSMDENHPQRQNTGRSADPVSGAYRLNERLPLQPLDLRGNEWREVVIKFEGPEVALSIDGTEWKEFLNRPCFDAPKRKLLWMQNGGEKGVEIDDVVVKRSGVTSLE